MNRTVVVGGLIGVSASGVIATLALVCMGHWLLAIAVYALVTAALAVTLSGSERPQRVGLSPTPHPADMPQMAPARLAPSVRVSADLGRSP